MEAYGFFKKNKFKPIVFIIEIFSQGLMVQLTFWRQ
jgi:hypothetical protein